MMRHYAYPFDSGSFVLVSTEPGRRGKTMALHCTPEQYRKGVADYKAGKLIQDAFPFLNDGEREFLLTGITPEEWNTMFEDEED